jgi:hypothetical protein
VLPPLSPRFETTRRSRIISEAIITQLAASGRLRIMDRDRLEILVEEHRLEYGGLFDESTLPAIGKLLGADSFIMGRYFAVQGGIQLYLRVVAADTGLIRSSQAVHLREDPVPPVDASNDMVAIGARLAPVAPGFHNRKAGTLQAVPMEQGMALVKTGDEMHADAPGTP